MIALFSKFTSGETVFRNKERVRSKQGISQNNQLLYNDPLWVQPLYRRRRGDNQEWKGTQLGPIGRYGTMYHYHGEFPYFSIYHCIPWQPVIGRMGEQSLWRDHGTRLPISLSPERKQGLADVTRIAEGSGENPRIVKFTLKKALQYSYMRDVRFISLTCLIIGFTAWWALTPYPLLEKPSALFLTPDPELLFRAVKDTFLNKVCTTHSVPTPCECGEPINNVVRKLFSQPETFDPLGINKSNASKVKALAISFALFLASRWRSRCPCMESDLITY